MRPRSTTWTRRSSASGQHRLRARYEKGRTIMNEITMPKLSDTMEEGKILRWLKHPGDTIHRGDAIAEVETDKADMVMESFDDGILDEVRLKEGESAKVGEVIAVMKSTDEAHAPDGASASPAQGSASESAAHAADSEADTAEAAVAAERPATRVAPLRLPQRRRRAPQAQPTR